jgi:Flp pilus assembly protein TadG
VVIPVFFMVVLGIAEFGRALMVSNLLTNAAREGARLSVIKGTTAQEVKDTVIAQVQNTVGVTLTNSDVSVTVTPYTGNPNPNNEPADAYTRDLCAVKVSVDYADVAYVVRFLGSSKLHGQAAMRHE